MATPGNYLEIVRCLSQSFSPRVSEFRRELELATDTPHFDLERTVKDQIGSGDLQSFDLPLKTLLGFSDGHNLQTDAMIPIRYSDYVQFVDWTVRAVRSDKAGAIPSHLDHIFLSAQQRLHMKSLLASHCKEFKRHPCQKHYPCCYRRLVYWAGVHVKLKKSTTIETKKPHFGEVFLCLMWRQ